MKPRDPNETREWRCTYCHEPGTEPVRAPLNQRPMCPEPGCETPMTINRPLNEDPPLNEEDGTC